MKPLQAILFTLVIFSCLSGCGGQPSSEIDRTSYKSSAFLENQCNSTEAAFATEITDSGFSLSGPNAVGGKGDYLLANKNAAFVISGIGPQKTYYHYPGILVDAVPMANCKQAGAENFYELALMVLRASLPTFTSSRMRAFRGESIEVINDGRNGEAAVVRVTGTDDTYWLVETVLMQESLFENRPLDYSLPFGLRIVVDYILEPGAATLKVKYQLQNSLPGFNGFTAAFALLNSGEGPPLNSFSVFDIKVDPVVLEHGIPWVTASDGFTSYAYGEDTRFLTTVDVIGVFGTVDLQQIANSYVGNFLNAHGRQGDTAVREFYVSVVQGDELRAVEQYIADIDPVIERKPAHLSIFAIDKATREPIPNVQLEVQMKKQVLMSTWPFETFYTAFTNERGKFSQEVPLISYLESLPYRVVATVEGRPNPAPIVIFPGQQNALVFEFEAPGKIAYDFTTEDGDELPTQLSFWQGDSLIQRFYLNHGQGELDIAPGEYQVAVSHGWEYEIVEKSLTVSPNTTALLSASLKHWVDTLGYLSFDAHVHSAPSPDSEVSLVDRITTAAATGLEVVVSTDHEIVTDLSVGVVAAGLQNWVATVIGQEVTAGLPNHTIAYPLPLREDIPRGDPIVWYKMTLAQIFAEAKSRGAQIRTLAHPRQFILDAIGWDRLLGAPTKTDNNGLGLPADAPLWSWDFEAVEYMNGIEKVFSHGLFEDWMSFINHGHRITATGASDMHDLKPPGMPRNYYPASSDRPSEFIEQELVDAVLEGNLLVSAGAFARVNVNGSAEMGDIATASDGVVSLSIHVEAAPHVDIDKVVVFVNCDVAEVLVANNPLDSAIKLSELLPIDIGTKQDAHLVVLGFGKKRLHREFPQFDAAEVPRFTTNPIYVDVNGNGVFDPPGGKSCNLRG
ncbi:MAG: CehA/McbA family metallohydrolase [Pseudomonadales bacterium]|nr:CehA/McbA family metallohydrolase [Pseudomonadales bacterium]